MKMNLKTIGLVIYLLLGFVAKVMSQQDPLYSLYMFNLASINPAYNGSNQFTTLTMQTRKQWVGFEGAPTTYLISVNQPLRFINSGVGFTLVSDNIGPGANYNILCDYSFHFTVYQKIKLGMGARGGIKYFRANLNDLAYTFDPALAENQYSGVVPTVGFGLFFYTETWYAGISTPEMLKDSYIFRNSSSSVSNPKEERHFFISAGYVFQFKSADIKLKPVVLAKKVYGAPFSLDFGLHSLFKNRYTLGCNYRFGDSVSPFLQIQLTDKFRIAYAYDYVTSKLQKYQNNTHEFAIFFDFNKLPERIISPRFF